MLFRAALTGRPVRAQLQGWLVGKRHWQIGSPLSLTHPANPRMKRELVFPAPFSFPFLWYFLCLLRQSLIFLTVWLTLSFPSFFVLCFHRHPTWLFLLWKEGRCLPRKDRGPLPVSKGIQKPRTKGPTRKQSGSERKIKREGMAVRENGIYRQAGPKRTHSWKRHIVKMREYKNVWGYRGKKIRLNFSQQLWWRMRRVTYNLWTPWLCQVRFLIHLGTRMKN